jgi:3-hydroxy-9,10-secoandrosta-1,3,5(10)-triene-9,17-dione monooxygenase
MTATAEHPTSTEPSAETLIARAEALVPVLRERARLCEELRRIPEETMRDLHEAGLLSLVSPPSVGGYGYGMREFGTVTRILAQGCASTAWVYSFLVVHNVSLVQDTPHLLRDKAFAACALSAGFQATPSGTARKVDGGWRLTGRWPFASGIMNSEYTLLITNEDRGEGGEPALLGLVVDVPEVTIHDVWHVSGMKGTGSNTFSCEGLFVPEDRQWTVFGQEPIHPLDHGEHRPLEGFSMIRMFDVLLAAVAVGSAEACLKDYKERILTRTVGFGLGPQREHPEAWVRYGDAVTRTRTARLVWDETHRVVTELSEAREKASLEQACLLRMASPRICQLAREAIDTMLDGAGSSVNELRSPFQRYKRDVDTLKSHSYLHRDGAAVTAGAALLGVTDEPDPLLLV